jgi:hypothetical protein
MDTETGPPRPLIEHVIERLPGALKANVEIKKKTGKGALNNLAFGAAISAQTVERMFNGGPEITERVLLANKTIMALDEAIEQLDQLGEQRVNQIVQDIKKWWIKDTDKIDIHPVIDELVSSMKMEFRMQAEYRGNVTIPSIKDYLDVVVPSNGVQLLAAAYASISSEADFIQRQRFKDESWDANLELRIRADWMKHTKDAAQAHLDLFYVAAHAYPGKSRGEVEEIIRAYNRPTTELPPERVSNTSIFLKEYTKNAAQFVDKATPILHLIHPPGKHDPYRA